MQADTQTADKIRLLQVCNVGNICGGTAACAWTITHSLPHCAHHIACLSHVTEETRQAFQHCTLHQVDRVDASLLKRSRPDVILLHNTAPERLTTNLPVPTIQYHHSHGVRAQAASHVACSSWLSQQIGQQMSVLHQPVPIAPQPDRLSQRFLTDELVIGRICTPSVRKWPETLIPFYEQLSAQHPKVCWEFVGAPDGLQARLQAACRGRARFHFAGFAARKHLWHWHALLYHHPDLTESFGRTAAEAMRVGCLPIVDRRGGFCEQVEHGQSGFLCHSVSEFSFAIDTISSLATWKSLSTAAVESANMKFSLAAFYERFRTLLGQTKP